MGEETLYLVYVYDSGGYDSEIPIAVGVYDNEIAAEEAGKHNAPEGYFGHYDVAPIKVGQLRKMEEIFWERHGQ